MSTQPTRPTQPDAIDPGPTRPLAGRVALVAGATRGAGRGVARMLGEAGATVYCTGRSVRGAPPTARAGAGRSETVEETAALVDAAGGRGIAVRVDHADEGDVAALAARIRRDHGRLDVLVNVLGAGQPTDFQPFWQLPVAEGRALTEAWLWPHVVTLRHALPLMLERRAGLVVEVLESPVLGYHGQLYFDLAVTSLQRLMYGLGEELAPHGVTTVAIAPGFMRTEEVLATLGATEATWQEVAERSAQARGYGFAGSETPCFVGRAIAALAADPDVRRWTGGLTSSWELSDAYGFTDVDGRRPHWGRYGVEHFPHVFAAAPRTGKSWRVERVGEPVPVSKRRVQTRRAAPQEA